MDKTATTSPTTLPEWLSYIEAIHPASIELGLDRVRQVADRLKLDFSLSRLVIVGGTNGKGSTVASLASILGAGGKTTATYMSPHLREYNERVMVDGKPALDIELCEAFAAVEAARHEVSLTYFEFGTLCAFVIFSMRKPDYIILEVGLGGRLDAVNIVEPDLVILTNVAMDHMDWLGSDREQIGREKAGILRPGIPAIYGERDVPLSVSSQADKLGARLLVQGLDFYWENNAGIDWNWHGKTSTGDSIDLESLPEIAFHKDNLACVLQAVTLLEPLITDQTIHRGLEKASLPGRMQQLGTSPNVILDVAHNAHAMKYLCGQIRHHFSKQKLHVVIAMLGDKDSREGARELSGLDACWYVGQIDDVRGAPAKILYNQLLEQGITKIRMFETVDAAYEAAKQAAVPDDLILVTGSFLTVESVLKLESRQ